MALKKAGLTRVRKELKGAMDRGVETAANYVADLASQLAPYDPEADHKHLNESIEVRGTKGSRKRKVVAGVGLPDPRAIVQEYGSADQPAQPYLTPALEAIDVKLEVKKEITKLIRGASR
ncbi:MAG TPA: HK97-gp10 family putative phage morphogenesis protein [Roseiflexaceae bacterium]|nr:HK97-gp10 family putative phage morphogenesis protein [Roseiflexaceae bacterium]